MTDSLPLQDKVALVTGAGSGLGRGIALKLAQNGARVAVAYVGDSTGAEETVGMFANPENGMIVAADIRSQAEVQAMVELVVARWGRLDVMVCNAGMFHSAPVLELQEAEWRRILDTNLLGTFFCAQAAARVMVERGTAGRIIIVASTQGLRPTIGVLPYATSKGALLTMARGMALELAPHHINVVTISPGVMEAAGNIAILSNPDVRRSVEAQVPIGRVGQPQDIGELAAFLASDGASFITGSNIVVDGGMYTTGPQL